jgi:hypothetical protein
MVKKTIDALSDQENNQENEDLVEIPCDDATTEESLEV